MLIPSANSMTPESSANLRKNVIGGAVPGDVIQHPACFFVKPDYNRPQKTEDLIGSVWEGINPHTDYFTKVEIKNDSKCAVTVYPSNSPANSYSEVCTYVYDSSTGNFNVKFDGYNITGFIKGDTMTLTDSGNGSYDLKRVK